MPKVIAKVKWDVVDALRRVRTPLDPADYPKWATQVGWVLRTREERDALIVYYFGEGSVAAMAADRLRYKDLDTEAGYRLSKAWFKRLQLAVNVDENELIKYSDPLYGRVGKIAAGEVKETPPTTKARAAKVVEPEPEYGDW